MTTINKIVSMPNNVIRLFVLTCCLLAVFTGGAAAQGCCSPGAPASGGLEKGGLEAGQFRLIPSVNFTHLGKLVNGSTRINDPTDRELDAWAYALDVEYGLTSRFTVMTSVSYSNRSRRFQSLAPGGGAVSFDADASGFGDLVLLGKYKLSRWNLRTQREIDFGVGVGFPTGAYDEKEGGIRVSRDLMPGAGSYQLILWSFLYKSFRPGPVGVSLSFIYNRPGSAEDEYRYGASLDYVAGTTYELTDLFDLYLQASGRWAASDRLFDVELSGTGMSATTTAMLRTSVDNGRAFTPPMIRRGRTTSRITVIWPSRTLCRILGRG